MGSQLRFDPSFFGLALRASAEADALLFSAHGDLSGIGCPARAGLTSDFPGQGVGRGRGILAHEDPGKGISMEDRNASRSPPATRASRKRIREHGKSACPFDGELPDGGIPQGRQARGESPMGIIAPRPKKGIARSWGAADATRASHADRIPIARRGPLGRLARWRGIPRLEGRQAAIPSPGKGFWGGKRILGLDARRVYERWPLP